MPEKSAAAAARTAGHEALRRAWRQGRPGQRRQLSPALATQQGGAESAQAQAVYDCPGGHGGAARRVLKAPSLSPRGGAGLCTPRQLAGLSLCIIKFARAFALCLSSSLSPALGTLNNVCLQVSESLRDLQANIVQSPIVQSPHETKMYLFSLG